MKAHEISEAIQKEKLPHSRINMAILSYLYNEYTEYHERYGVLIHPKLGIAAGIPLPNYLGVLEAAIEAVTRLLPQADWSIYSGKGSMYEGTVWINNNGDDEEQIEFSVAHGNAASELLAAAFLAKNTAMKEDEDD
jgi:hypothetical protein